jgi:hypothetical protein
MEQMTILQSRPILRVRPTPDGPGRSALVSAGIAAAWTAGCGLLTALGLAVAAWFTADTGSFGGAVRIGALGWLVAQGGGLHLGEVEITAIPVGACLVVGLLLYRGGRWVGSTSRIANLRDVVGATAVLAAVYAGIALVVFGLTRSDTAHADLLRVVVWPLVLAGGFGGLGMLRAAGLAEPVLARLPSDVRTVLTGALAGICAMVTISGLAFAVSVVLHFSDAVRLAESIQAGMVGGLILALVGLAAVPNGMLCAGAYLAGPGFVLGTGSIVSPFDVQLGPLPALPVLAATPRSSGAWWQEGLLVVPVLAGAIAGLAAARRCAAGAGPVRVVGLASGSGAAAGLGFGLSTWLATGAVGPGRMQDIGPDVLLTTLVCIVAFALGATMCALGTTWWSQRSG